MPVAWSARPAIPLTVELALVQLLEVQRDIQWRSLCRSYNEYRGSDADHAAAGCQGAECQMAAGGPSTGREPLCGQGP